MPFALEKIIMAEVSRYMQSDMQNHATAVIFIVFARMF